MATYAELANIYNQNTLRDKLVAAVSDVACTIYAEDGGTVNHANRLIWAKATLKDPIQTAHEITFAVLVANKTFTVAQIVGATDAALLAAVANVVNLFATGT